MLRRKVHEDPFGGLFIFLLGSRYTSMCWGAVCSKILYLLFYREPRSSMLSSFSLHWFKTSNDDHVVPKAEHSKWISKSFEVLFGHWNCHYTFSDGPLGDFRPAFWSMYSLLHKYERKNKQNKLFKAFAPKKHFFERRKEIKASGMFNHFIEKNQARKRNIQWNPIIIWMPNFLSLQGCKAHLNGSRTKAKGKGFTVPNEFYSTWGGEMKSLTRCSPKNALICCIPGGTGKSLFKNCLLYFFLIGRNYSL